MGDMEPKIRKGGGGDQKNIYFLRAISPAETARIFLTEKASPPLRNLVIFPTKCNKKTMISAAKK